MEKELVTSLAKGKRSGSLLFDFDSKNIAQYAVQGGVRLGLTAVVTAITGNPLLGMKVASAAGPVVDKITKEAAQFLNGLKDRLDQKNDIGQQQKQVNTQLKSSSSPKPH